MLYYILGYISREDGVKNISVITGAFFSFSAAAREAALYPKEWGVFIVKEVG